MSNIRPTNSLVDENADMHTPSTLGKSTLPPAAEIFAGILRADAGNDRSNWVVKPKPPLGEIVRLDDSGVSMEEQLIQAFAAAREELSARDWAYRFAADYYALLLELLEEEYFAEQSDGDAGRSIL